jgi:LuxR family maltose regulon positive regulatory protein
MARDRSPGKTKWDFRPWRLGARRDRVPRVGARAGTVSGGGPLPVPRSKFGCPAVPVRAIARPRLGEVLAQPEWRVALVTGGPATGKTVSVAQWFQTLDPIAREWVTLDAGDERPERFWLTFVLALERAVPGAFAQAAAAEADVHRLPPEFLDRLLTAWSAVTDPLVIVLEDAHHLQSPEITGDLGFVVEHLPGRSRMLLTSRVDPHLPVSRWRGRGWLAELRQRDLAFTLPETAELFTALGEHRLSTSDVERLWRQTEGWAAGLRLAAAGLRDRADIPAAVAEFSGRTPVVADLLADELLHRAPGNCRSSCCGRRSPTFWTRSCAARCRGAATAGTCSGGWRPACSS